MKKNLFLLIFLWCIAIPSFLYAQTVAIPLTNATIYDRAGETVEFPVSQEIYGALTSLALYDENDAIIPYQVLSSADRKIVFQATVGANATVVYTLKSGTPTAASVKTYAAQKIPATRNDIAWENDLSAYRMYSKVLLANEPNTANGVDIWYKKQTAPIIDAMYGYSSPDYHNEVADRVGVDAYSVGGKTLGGGGIVPFVNSQLLLHDPYDECTIIENGPLRSEFILTYKKVLVDGDYYTKTVHVTANAGALLNKAVVKFEGKLKPMKLAAGLFRHTGTNGVAYTSESNIIGYAEDKSEGSVLNASSRMYTGVYMPGETAFTSHTATNHLVISGDYAPGSEFTYYFGGGWNQFPAGKYTSDQDWFNALKQFKTSIANPLVQTAEKLPLKKEVIAVAERANNYWIATHTAPGDNLWARSVYFAGNMDFYKVYSKKIYLNYALDWATRNNWAVSNGPSTANADNHTCGQAYIDMYLLDSVKVQSKISAIKNAIDYRIANNTASDDWWWIDAMFMAMPTIARLGVVYNDPRYFDKLYAMYRNTRDTLVVNPAVSQLWSNENKAQYGQGPIVTCPTCGNESDGLYNPADKLWWRDWGYQPGVPTKGSWVSGVVNVPKISPNGRNIYWARGNGWVLGAMVRTLQFVPDTNAHYSEYVTMLQDMAEALKNCQRADGFWNMNLGDPDHFPGPETSGTAFFTYGLAWGINNGLLDRDTYYPVVAKAWNGLASIAVQASGKVKYTQNVGEMPVEHTQLNPDVDFGVGAVLLAASEVVKLAEGEMPQVPTETLSLLSAQLLSNNKQVKVSFDSDLESVSALNTSNYIIRLESPLATELTPASAALDGTKSVILTFTDSLDYGRYNLTSSEIKSTNDAVLEVESKRFLRTVPLSPLAQPVTITASGYQNSGANVNPPANAIDNNLATRWAHNGTGQWLRFDLGKDVEVYAVDIAYHAGDQRIAYFAIQSSLAAQPNTYSNILTGGTSSGITTEMERYAFPARTARYVRLVCNGNSTGGENWNSITEVRVRYSEKTNATSPAIAEKKIKIIPNPVVNGQLTVDLGEGLQDKTTLTVWDMNGKSCIFKQIRTPENKLQIDVRNLPQGIYILSIDNRLKQFHDTFIIK
jgi:rhamnogalacturonyl hydrolase YesR